MMKFINARGLPCLKLDFSTELVEKFMEFC